MAIKGLAGRRALVSGAASGIGQAVRRAGTPDDVARVVAVLCSDAGGYVSGATIDVNGGWYFGP